MLREDQESLCEGILACPNPQCLHEYPVIDGIPILISDLRAYITQNIIPLLKRSDLSSTMESLLGDCCGPGSAFDWSAYATSLESWIGGHSQRSENQGRSAVILRSLFENGGHLQAINGLALEAEVDNVPWTLRLHDRSFINYFAHLLVGRKRPDPALSHDAYSTDQSSLA